MSGRGRDPASQEAVEVINQSRAARANRALAAARYGREAPEEGLIDILTDLQHFAAATGIDFENSLRIAQQHYATEKS